MSHDKTHIVEKEMQGPCESGTSCSAAASDGIFSVRRRKKKKYKCTIVKIGGLASRMWGGRRRVQTDSASF